MLEYLESPAGAAMIGRVLFIAVIVGVVWLFAAGQRARQKAKAEEASGMERATAAAVKTISDAFDEQDRRRAADSDREA